MTDLEFYQKALIYQSFIVNHVAQSKAYDFLSNKEVKETLEKYYSNEDVRKLFSIDNLTIERAKALRFLRWDEEMPNLYLFPLWFVFFIPYGTKVIGIGGEEFEYTKETDLDNRCGCVAFGINLYK